MLKEDLKEILIGKKIEYEKKYASKYKAYESWLSDVELSCKLTGLKFNEEQLENIFPKPEQFLSDEEEEINESEDIIEKPKEYYKPKGNFNVDKAAFGSWINEENKNKFIQNKFYRKYVYEGIGNIPDDVKDEIELHSLKILSRCNNPEDWEQTSNKPDYEHPKILSNWKVEDSDNWFLNKTGLVYGMVQSGKTASMIALMGLAHAAGYNLFILLCGGKNSLRDQTQDRVNKAFGLTHFQPVNSNIVSITKKNDDYVDSTDGLDNGFQVYENFANKSVIICIKKEINQLNKLLKHFKEAKKDYRAKTIFKGFKALIIDDEADYASQNTRKNKESAINKVLGDIRSILAKNCYVAYTASPQACIAASHKNLIGYPNSFIWLLDPFRDEKTGLTTSYLGLEEFFGNKSRYSSELVKIIGKETWPHWDKNDSKKKGIYKPDGSIETGKLTYFEAEYLSDCIKHKKLKIDFIEAIVDFIISGSFKWLDHIKNYDLDSNWITKEKINQELRDSESDSKYNFPYHAMMFNLSYVNANQRKLLELIEIQFDYVKDDFKIFFNGFEDKYFTNGFKKQQQKSQLFGKDSMNYKKSEVKDLMKIFIELVSETITEKEEFIYVLNSEDDGDSLNYDSSSDKRTKKAAIMLGGHILSRGLTIEELSTSFFVRSQSMSLGDTNLQMCRWFGHKKENIEYISLYIQNHSYELFVSLADIDYRLRYNFAQFIMNDVKANCMLLSLRNSAYFKATSPSKSKWISKDTRSSYSAKTVDCTDMMNHADFMNNEAILKKHIHKIKSNGTLLKWQQERAYVFYDVYYSNFKGLFEELKFDKNSLNISPQNFMTFLDEWKEKKDFFPKINIAFFGYDENWEPKNIERARHGTNKSIKSKKEAVKKSLKKISNLRSTRDRQGYIGDVFIDRSQNWIDEYRTKTAKERKRKIHDDILIIFWVLNGNYLCKNFYVEPGESDYMNNPLVSFSVVVPPGGPFYSIYTNKGKENEVYMQSECVDVLQNLALL